MIPLSNNVDIICYYVTKHSWKGKYSRIFSIGTHGITTYNLNNLDITNKWPYEDLLSIKGLPQTINEFTICVRKGRDKKPDNLRFSTPYRLSVISDVLRFKQGVTGLEKQRLEYYPRYECFKYHWSETKLPVMLEITQFSLDQLDITTNQILASYYYKDIEMIQEISDIKNGFVIISAPFGRMHLFSNKNKEDIFIKMKEQSTVYLCFNIHFSNESITYDEFIRNRLGRCSNSDQSITSISEFSVTKIQITRHLDGQKRLLCLTTNCLLERDPQSYSIVTLKPLYLIYALIRDPDDSQLFTIEYTNGIFRTYSAVQRDSLLATLLDCVRASGNHNVHVKMCFTPRDKRLIPLNANPEEELETQHLKFLSQPPAKKAYAEIIDRFNAVVPYSGLLHAVTQDGLFSGNKEKLIIIALQTIIMKNEEFTIAELEAQFQCLRRLVASKVGFAALTMISDFRERLGKKVTKSLKLENEAITHAAIDMICTLMQPMHSDYDLHREQLNKSSLLSSKIFLQTLLDMWTDHIKRNTGSLVVTAMLDMLTFALCIPYSETTEGKHFDILLSMVAERGRYLYQLFQNTSLTIVKGAGLIMRALVEEGEASVAKRMQELALSEGALLTHLLIALYTRDGDTRLLTMRHLSRHLVGLWITNNDTAMNLLTRIIPYGLLNFLESDELAPEELLSTTDLLMTRDNLKLAQDLAAKGGASSNLIERKFKNLEKEIEKTLSHWGASLGLERRDEKFKDRPVVVLRKRRERIKSDLNWKLFYYKFNRDHTTSMLIWNHKTREELRESLEKELRTFSGSRELLTTGNNLISWNHSEFEIKYSCLQDEVCIDGYYLKLMLESTLTNEFFVKNPAKFFNDLYHRFLLTTKTDMRCLCLQAMTIVYNRYYDDIGGFEDTKFIITMLERCLDFLERDRLLLFLDKLISLKENVKRIIDANGATVLVELLTLAHLHTSRAITPMQSNVIEAGTSILMQDNEKEWYFAIGDDRKGPITLTELRELFSDGRITGRTKCWSQGMDGWRSLHQINQLKWTLLGKNQSIMNESELASLILSILIRMCRYFPSKDLDGAIIWPIARVKRALSEPQCLPHIVQLLLTFDSILVEKVAILLCELAADNPAGQKFYITGVFFFILMYTGSNVLPIAQFLKLTHISQAFRSTDNPSSSSSSELMQRSVLGALLPDAMVYYLENHGAEKFAEIFLGEFDTPEAIWNSEMRRMLIEKIASHIADFTPRLRANNRALYQYCGIPAIRYPQLQTELFCNIFYLRHLCDQIRFPNWPISEPVKLLRDVLERWREEVEKKPPAMSTDDAYEALELERGIQHPEHVIRKAYYRLAQIYHPDKNPNGKDKFLVFNKAYDFLCSRISWTENRPNPNNIVLILQTQSILFGRYSAELHEYKYAGYQQLIKTIQLETADDQLFSKPALLLTAATELAYHTVKCSALNAEELNREYGFTSILDAYSRCISVLNASSKSSDIAVQVCSHCTQCFSVAAQFSACRETFTKMPNLIVDLVRVLHFKHLTKLCCLVVECITNFVVKDAILLGSVLEQNVQWHLLSFLFKYDFTLEECGVERSENANQQEIENRLAKLSVKACSALCGSSDSNRASSESNPTAKNIFNQILTPFIVEQLIANEDPHLLLKTLTSNCETPYLIWNNQTRAELTDFLERKCEERVEDLQSWKNVDFKYSCHDKELIIGNIFVRIYINQPNYPIREPEHFLFALLDYIKKQNCSELLQEELENVNSALQCLNFLVSANQGLETKFIGNFEILFSLLNISNLQQNALAVIATSTRNQHCVDDIARNPILILYLFFCLYSLIQKRELILDILNTLCTSSIVVKDILTKGEYIYLLDILCNSDILENRQKSSEIISRLLSDKLSGPRVRIVLGRYLPYAICETLKDGPTSSVVIQLLDSDCENPELLWNDKCRKKIYSGLKKLAKQHLANQKTNPNVLHKLLAEEDNIFDDIISGIEVVVTGVYLRLFIQNPGWNVRKPKEFLTDLLDVCLNSMMNYHQTAREGNVGKLELYTLSIIRLLEAQPNLSDHVPSLGYLPKLCLQLLTSADKVSCSAIAILHQLSYNELCVGSLSQTECLAPLKHAMKTHRNIIGIGSETLGRLFVSGKDYLVKQALDVQLVPFLLELLDDRNSLLREYENEARIKAQIVKTLKDMTRSLTYGNCVIDLLDKSPIWSAYRDQNHDLFLTASTNSASSFGHLTCGAPLTSGYLTQGTSKQMPSLPPPVNNNQDY